MLKRFIPLGFAAAGWAVAFGILLWTQDYSTYDPPSHYFPDQNSIVNYPQLLFEHRAPSMNDEASSLFESSIVAFTILGLLILMTFGSAKAAKTSPLALLLLLGACGFITAVMVPPRLTPDGTVLETVQELTFQDRVYYLTRASTRDSSANLFEARYIVYRCDEAGRLCVVLTDLLDTNSVGVNMPPVRLQADGESLYVYIGDDATPVAP